MPKQGGSDQSRRKECNNWGGVWRTFISYFCAGYYTFANIGTELEYIFYLLHPPADRLRVCALDWHEASGRSVTRSLCVCGGGCGLVTELVHIKSHSLYARYSQGRHRWPFAAGGTNLSNTFTRAVSKLLIIVYLHTWWAMACHRQVNQLAAVQYLYVQADSSIRCIGTLSR